MTGRISLFVGRRAGALAPAGGFLIGQLSSVVMGGKAAGCVAWCAAGRATVGLWHLGAVLGWGRVAD